jgi:hypothetical protein
MAKRSPTREATKTQTTKARAAVALTSEGIWRVLGVSGHTDSIITDTLLTDFPKDAQIFWITAELPIIPQNIEAQVEHDDR